MQKQKHKAWHDTNIKSKNISLGDLVLLYESQIKGKPIKLEIAWLGPYIIMELNENGSLGLKTLEGQVFKGVVNVSRLIRYHT